MDYLTSIYHLHLRYYRSITTNRLLLRPFIAEDYKDMYEYTSLSNSFQFIKRSPHVAISETMQFVHDAIESCGCHQNFIWAIEENSSHKLIGTCRLFDISIEDRRAEISYMLNPNFSKMGYASEAVQAVCEYVFSEMDFLRLQARCVGENLASERVMQKCGMQMEGTLRNYSVIHGKTCDFKIYARIKEWKGESS